MVRLMQKQVGRHPAANMNTRGVHKSPNLFGEFRILGCARAFGSDMRHPLSRTMLNDTLDLLLL
jgi:hypothetical protein